MKEQQVLHASIVPAKPPVIAAGHTPGSVTEKISSVVLRKMPRWWYAAFGISFLLMMGLMFALLKLLFEGTGIWGVNIPVGWGSRLTRRCRRCSGTSA